MITKTAILKNGRATKKKTNSNLKFNWFAAKKRYCVCAIGYDIPSSAHRIFRLCLRTRTVIDSEKFHSRMLKNDLILQTQAKESDIENTLLVKLLRLAKKFQFFLFYKLEHTCAVDFCPHVCWQRDITLSFWWWRIKFFSKFFKPRYAICLWKSRIPFCFVPFATRNISTQTFL